MIRELIEQIKETYLATFEHVKDAWPKLLGWTSAWFILYWVFQGSMEQQAKNAQLLSSLNVEGGDVIASGLGAFSLWGVSFVFGISMIYSLCALALQTKDDPSVSWLHCGIQGILNPMKAFKVGACFELARYFVYYAALAISIPLLFLLGKAGLIFIAGIFLVYFYFVLRVSMSWFNYLDNPEQGALYAISKSFNDLKGRVAYMVGILLPVIALIGLIALGGHACEAKRDAYFQIEVEMAQHAAQAIQTARVEDQNLMNKLETSAYNDRDIAKLKKVMSNKIYDKPIPAYENHDSLESFVAAMAEYGYHREKFEANRDNREPAQITSLYIERISPSGAWTFMGFICDILLLCLFSISLALMAQIYRQMESMPISIPQLPETKKEEEKPQSQTEPLKQKQMPVPASGQTSNFYQHKLDDDLDDDDGELLRRSDFAEEKEEMPSFVVPEFNIPEFSAPEVPENQDTAAAQSEAKTTESGETPSTGAQDARVASDQKSNNESGLSRHRKTMALGSGDLDKLSFNFPVNQQATPERPLLAQNDAERKVSQASTPEFPLLELEPISPKMSDVEAVIPKDEAKDQDAASASKGAVGDNDLFANFFAEASSETQDDKKAKDPFADLFDAESSVETQDNKKAKDPFADFFADDFSFETKADAKADAPVGDILDDNLGVEKKDTQKAKDPFADFFNPSVPKGPANVIKR